jgi:hypothetical protein
MRPHGSLSRCLVLKTDSYGPLIQLGIWSLSADSHFGAQSLAQSLLASPPFIWHACCLRARGPNEYSFHGYFAFRSQPVEAELTKPDVADPLQIDHAPLGGGVALDWILCFLPSPSRP